MRSKALEPITADGWARRLARDEGPCGGSRPPFTAGTWAFDGGTASFDGARGSFDAEGPSCNAGRCSWIRTRSPGPRSAYAVFDDDVDGRERRRESSSRSTWVVEGDSDRSRRRRLARSSWTAYLVVEDGGHRPRRPRRPSPDDADRRRDRRRTLSASTTTIVRGDCAVGPRGRRTWSRETPQPDIVDHRRRRERRCMPTRTTMLVARRSELRFACMTTLPRRKATVLARRIAFLQARTVRLQCMAARPRRRARMPRPKEARLPCKPFGARSIDASHGARNALLRARPRCSARRESSLARKGRAEYLARPSASTITNGAGSSRSRRRPTRR
jgi:hypothetical protein